MEPFAPSAAAPVSHETTPPSFDLAELFAGQKNRASALESLFSGAFRLQQDGRLVEAARLYEQILKIDPRHADSLHLLGLIAAQAGKPETAIDLIGRAIAINGNEAAYYSNLGTIVQARGQLNEAAGCYRRALELNPQLAEVHLNLGLVEHLRGHLEAAEADFRRAAELRPELAEAWSNLGNLLEQQGRLDEAEGDFRRAIELKPGFAEAHYNLGNVLQARERLDAAAEAFGQALRLKPDLAEAWANLGNVRQSQERLAEAEACQRQVLALRPDHVEAHYNLGNVLALAKHSEEAAAELEEALRLNPGLTKARNNLGNVLRTLERYEESVAQYRMIPHGDTEFAGAYNNMGLALLALGRHEEAIDAIKQTLALDPSMAEAYCNLGAVYHAQNHLNTAELCYRQAHKIRSDLPKNRMNMGLIHLARGNFSEGWKEYEWRWENAPLERRGFSQPEWRGEPLNGLRILLHAEQGYGDTLQFIRYAPLVARAGGRVVLEVQNRLVRLAEELEEVEEVVWQGRPLPQFDCHCPLLSLPAVFGTTLDTIPAEVPYVRVPAEARQKMEAVDWPADKLKIGLNWAGNPSFKSDRYRFRSVELETLAPLFGRAGTQFYSLQVGAEEEQLKHSSLPIEDLAGLTYDLADTAAQMLRLDLVISADTSVVHLAGALGVPVWVLLPYSADWRWLLDRGDSPWYPSMRLFQQIRPGDWEPVIATVREALDEVLSASTVVSRMNAWGHRRPEA
jgi:tetratricopeptide (TPR) repeat protein